jgi:hypothetical protein
MKIQKAVNAINAVITIALKRMEGTPSFIRTELMKKETFVIHLIKKQQPIFVQINSNNNDV